MSRAEFPQVRFPPGAQGGGGHSRQVGWLVASFAVTSLVAVADLLLSTGTVLVGLLVLGPLLASARLSSGWTALTGGYALGLAAALGPADRIFATPDYFIRLMVLCIGAGLAVYVSYSRTSRERWLASVARIAQETILQPFPEHMGAVRFATRYRCADRDVLVGGDVFDVANTEHGVRVLIADVRGKGLGSTLTAAATVRAFRNAAYTVADLRELMRQLDRALVPVLGEEDFVTAAAAEFHPGGVTVVNSGHHPPLLLGAHPRTIEPPHPDLPLGMGCDPPSLDVPMLPEERLLLYTDGIAEARDTAGRMFDLVTEAAAVPAELPLEDALDALLYRMDAHIGRARASDDVALVLAEPTSELSSTAAEPA